RRLAALDAAVEHLAIREGAVVVHDHDVGRLRAHTGALDDRRELDPVGDLRRVAATRGTGLRRILLVTGDREHEACEQDGDAAHGSSRFEGPNASSFHSTSEETNRSFGKYGARSAPQAARSAARSEAKPSGASS